MPAAHHPRSLVSLAVAVGRFAVPRLWEEVEILAVSTLTLHPCRNMRARHPFCVDSLALSSGCAIALPVCSSGGPAAAIISTLAPFRVTSQTLLCSWCKARLRLRSINYPL